MKNLNQNDRDDLPKILANGISKLTFEEQKSLQGKISNPLISKAMDIEFLEIDNMSFPALKQRWMDLHNTQKALPGFSKEFLKNRIKYRLQELVYGSFDEKSKSQLSETIKALSAKKYKRNRNLPVPGTIIVRVYKGKEHRIRVLRYGFEYEGGIYNNLSSVAGRITNNRCRSGKQFFKLVD